jgi:hypothetical protein
MTLDQTVIRVAARVRPSEHARVSRELRRRIRAGLDEVRAPDDDDAELAAAQRRERRQHLERTRRIDPDASVDDDAAPR